MALAACHRWSLIDIGVNLTDDMFKGIYQGRQCHQPDMDRVLERSEKVGVRGLLLTGSNVRECNEAIRICERYSTPLFRCLCTVGCHPTRCVEFGDDPEGYFTTLDDLLRVHSVTRGGCVAAIGEIGLDYDRLSFTPKDVQLTYFVKQLGLAERHQLPLFLHDRNTNGDFYDIIERHRSRVVGGVVHSFTGTQEELSRCVELGLYIGINGCSLKTQENIDVVKRIPLDRLLIETDAPWCEVRNTHASRSLLNAAARKSEGGRCDSDLLLSQFTSHRKDKFVAGAAVKGRCEPCNLVQVLEVLYELHRNEVGSMEVLGRIVTENTKRLFPSFAGVGAGSAVSPG